jgi:hypothetical protein
MTVVPLESQHFSVPSQERVRRDQGLKFVQDLASEGAGFSGESTAVGVGKTDAPPAQAVLEHAVLFLEILNHVQLMAVDPTGEHQEQQLKRPIRLRHFSRVYR